MVYINFLKSLSFFLFWKEQNKCLQGMRFSSANPMSVDTLIGEF